MANNLVANGVEFLVSLGVQLDTTNMTKFTTFLTSGKLQAAAMGVAVTALTKVIYNFINSQTSLEQSYDSLARKESKSVETIRARETALKVMGKTQKEVASDPNLNKIYKNLQSLSKEIALPDFSKVMANVYELEGAWYKLKFTVQYTLNWINYHLLRELAEPIKQITGWINKIQTWLSTNIKTVSSRIALYASDFLRGILEIFTIIQKIGNYIDQLPESVKAVGTAIVAVVALIKSGPLGWLVTAITLVGDLMKDYENYQKNIANQGKDGWTDIDIALPELWEIVSDPDKSWSAKVQEGIDSVSESIKGLFNGKTLLENIEDWFVTNQDDVNQFAQTIWGVITTALNTVQTISFDLVGVITNALAGHDLTEYFSRNKASESLTSGLVTWMLTGNGWAGLGATIITTLTNAINDTDGTAEDWATFGTELWTNIVNELTKVKAFADENGPKLQEWISGVWADIQKMMFGELDANGVRTGGLWDTIVEIFSPITDAITDAFVGAFSGLWETISPYLEIVGANIMSWLNGVFKGTFLEGIFNFDGMTAETKYGVGTDNKIHSLAEMQEMGYRPEDIITAMKNPFANELNNGNYTVKDGVPLVHKLGYGDAQVYGEAQKGISAAVQSGDFVKASQYLQVMSQYNTDMQIANKPFSGVSRSGTNATARDNIALIESGNYAAPGDDEAADKNEKAAVRMEGSGRRFDDASGDMQASAASYGQATESYKTYVDEFGTIVDNANDFASSLASAASSFRADVDKNAMGGRYDSKLVTEVAEDGDPEYIIPVKKSNRAIPLMVNALREMGSAAAKRVIAGMGMDGGVGTFGGSLAVEGASFGGAVTINNTYNVSAPVTITVNGGGADAETIGSVAYSAAERSLVRTLEGVLD